MDNTGAKKEQSKSFSFFSLFFYLAVFIIAVFCIHYFGAINDNFKLFKTVRPIWLIVALFSQTGTYFFNALSFKVLLRVYTEKKIFSLRELFETSIVSFFFSQTIPSAGWSGKAFFSRQLVRRGLPLGKSVSLMFIELIAYYSAMLLTIFLLFIVGSFFHFPGFFFLIFLLGILAYAVLSGFAMIAGKKKVIDYILKKIKVVGFIRRKIEKYEKTIDASGEESSDSALKAMLSKKKLMIAAIGCSLSVIICESMTIFALFQGLNIPINFFLVIAGYMLIQITTLLPTLPGSLLVFEGGLSFYFASMGLPLGVALTVTLLYRCLSFWLPILAGFLLFKKLEKANQLLSDN
jgi:uncharacterized protein (TIRG00374 family)